ncbi:unnamed protein product [Cochlearia groenlandica]
MANMNLELNIYSAKDLENVNLITKMDVYAVVYINGGDSSQKIHKEKTAVDRTGESESTWNHAVKFSVNQRLLREGRLTLVVKLVCDRILGDKDIGEVQVPVMELFPGLTPSSNGNGVSFVTYQVKTPSGKGQGSLTFSYRFDTPSFKPDLPVSSNNLNSSDSPSDLPSTTFNPPCKPSFYPPLSSIEYPSPSQPQGYPVSPYTYPLQNRHVTVYTPSNSASNFYHPSSYGGSPPHYPYVYPPLDKSGHSYHQTQPSQSFKEYGPWVGL